MKWFVRLLALLGMLILAMLITGSVLPEKHMATVSREFNASREHIWAILTDFEHLPQWRSDLKEIKTGTNTFTEVSESGDVVEYRIDEFSAPERLVTTIVTPDLPYGGSWTYELEPTESGCKLTITENGEVYNPLFRFMSKYMFGHTTTMEQFMNDLTKKVN